MLSVSFETARVNNVSANNYRHTLWNLQAKLLPKTQENMLKI